MSETPATPAADDVEAHAFRAWDATTDEAGTDGDDVEAHLRRNVHSTGGGEGDVDVQKHLRSN
jgi:hypothetical protein